MNLTYPAGICSANSAFLTRELRMRSKQSIARGGGGGGLGRSIGRKLYINLIGIRDSNASGTRKVHAIIAFREET